MILLTHVPTLGFSRLSKWCLETLPSQSLRPKTQRGASVPLAPPPLTPRVTSPGNSTSKTRLHLSTYLSVATILFQATTACLNTATPLASSFLSLSLIPHCPCYSQRILRTEPDQVALLLKNLQVSCCTSNKIQVVTSVYRVPHSLLFPDSSASDPAAPPEPAALPPHWFACSFSQTQDPILPGPALTIPAARTALP